MKSLHHWMIRVPQIVRIALILASIAGVVLGGSADHYWS
jgi:hypothetical protein